MISFLIPVSRESYKDSLDSILSKEIKYNYEIILCFNNYQLYKKIPKGIRENPKIEIISLSDELWFYSYKILHSFSSKKYIYYLEDDDKLLTDFSFLDKYPNYDYYFGLYKNHPNHDSINWSNEIKELNKSFYELFKRYKTPEDFYYFQLSQLLIKRDIIKNIPLTDNKYNDYYLFKNNPGKIKYIYKYFFKQGWNGDNYSQKG